VDGNPNWRAFASAALVTSLCGGVLSLACANGAGGGLTLQQSFLLTSGTWAALPFFAALPMMLGAPGASFTDALFESMSGLTTTGSTVFVGLDGLPRGTNLWRGILQWLGGLGIVIVALIFLPVMRVGGMQFFRSEGFDTLGKVLPRALDISSALIQIYIGMTVICCLVYLALGMSGFAAVVHALTTVSTGGFSIHDDSFSRYSGALEYVAVVFMLLASLPFVRYIQMVQGQPWAMLGDVQVRAFLRWVGYAVLMVVAYRVAFLGADPLPAFGQTAFNVVTLFTGTGYSSADVTLWGSFSMIVIITVGFIGGCTSSTGCSVKVFRYLVVLEAIRAQVKRLLSPSAVVPVRLGGRSLGEDVIASVAVFFTLFVISFGILAVGLSMAGLSNETALTAAWTALANIGPAYGPEVGPTGAFDAFPTAAKWMMIAAMMVGRLELLSVYVLFTARFWMR
jgi:trk system potassium uptake protein TrkH